MALEVNEKMNSKIARARLSNEHVQLGDQNELSYLLANHTLDTENSTDKMGVTTAYQRSVPWHTQN